MDNVSRSHGVVRTGAGATAMDQDMTIIYKVTSADTDGAWSLVEYTLPPYAQGTPLHWHRKTDEAIYVLDGLLALTIDDHTMTASPGTVITIPAGARHAFFNPTATPIRLLLWFCPGGSEGYWMHPGQSAEHMAALGATYDLYLPDGAIGDE